jgi:DNA-binding LacI/PurR family transcriptional regulator
VRNITEESINAGDVYVSVMEDDLVLLLERIITEKLEVGKQVGIISYNETPYKQFLLNGITTVSTDFEQMGRMAANLIIEGKKDQLALPFRLLLRSSL